VGLEHLEPSDLRIRSWGNVADGVTFTNRFRPGHVLFGKRRAYQRKVAVAEFDGICSSDIYVFEPADGRLLSDLLPFICQTEGFFEHALKTSAGSLSPRTNWSSLADYEFDLPPIEEQRSRVSVLQLAHIHSGALKEVSAAARRLLSALAQDFEARHPESITLADLVTRLEPGSSPPSDGVAVAEGPAVLKVSAVGDWVFREDENKSILPKYFDSAAEVHPGDILFTRANADVAGVGRSCVVGSCRGGLMLSDKTWRSRLHPQFADYGYALVAVSKGTRFRAHVERVLAGTEAKNISQQRLLAAPVPKAPQAEWEALNRYASTVLAAYDTAVSRSANPVSSLVTRHVL
jgi:type I restriction enzyme S subunit